MAIEALTTPLLFTAAVTGTAAMSWFSRRKSDDSSTSAYKPGWHTRMVRRWYQKDLGKIIALQKKIDALKTHGPNRTLGQAQLEQGNKLWQLSTYWGAGRWSEAETAWIDGALTMLGLAIDATEADASHLERANAYLFGKNIIKENLWKGTVDNDDFLITWSVGAASNGTVWKIFGQQAAAKVFDGGALQHRAIQEGQSTSTPFDVASYIKREAQVLREVAQLTDDGLDATHVYAMTDAGFVRELIDGITRGNEKYLLPLNQIPPVRQSFEQFNAALIAAGYTEYDGDLTGNVVYHPTRGWILIDY